MYYFKGVYTVSWGAFIISLLNHCPIKFTISTTISTRINKFTQMFYLILNFNEWLCIRLGRYEWVYMVEQLI